MSERKSKNFMHIKLIYHLVLVEFAMCYFKSRAMNKESGSALALWNEFKGEKEGFFRRLKSMTKV